MSKMKFLDSKEAKKFEKQKWNVFCWTPCNIVDRVRRKGINWHIICISINNTHLKNLQLHLSKVKSDNIFILNTAAASLHFCRCVSEGNIVGLKIQNLNPIFLVAACFDL